MKKYHQLIPYVALALAVLFWGLSFVGSKIALQSFTPFTLIFMRFSAASCFFLVVLFYRGFPKFTSKDHGQLLLAALLQPGLYYPIKPQPMAERLD